MYLPSGERQTQLTDEVCRNKESPNLSPVSVFHTMIVESSLPETRVLPS
jgi:hypothetical protein